MLKKIINDKRILVVYIVVIFALTAGLTYALTNTSLAFNLSTAIMEIDTEQYGNTSFDASTLDLKPIIDSELESRDGVFEDVEAEEETNVIRIDFTVGGAEGNTADVPIIYVIALTDLDVNCNLISPNLKWKLIKHAGTDETEEVVTGSLNYAFDTIVDGRLLLTTTAKDLPQYNSSQTGYHNYTFYMWFSDACQATTGTCANYTESQMSAIEQSALLGKYLSGKIEVELFEKGESNEDPVTFARNPSDELDVTTCTHKGYLSSMPAGSYVSYTGNNGCQGASCKGQNANYVNGSNMGHCYSTTFKYHQNGWRIAYTYNGSAYLISGGAVDCICTDSSGTVSNSGCANYLSIENSYQHFENLNKEAQKYCNVNYAKNGICDETTVWSMNDFDFKKITNNPLTDESCYHEKTSVECGYDNPLIDIGGYYWLTSYYTLFVNYTLRWDPGNRYVGVNTSEYLNGLRPVIRLDPSIMVIDGTGTYTDPYIISSISEE